MRVKVKAGHLRDAVEQVRATTEPNNSTFAGLYFEASHRPDGTARVRLFTLKPGAKTLMAVEAEVEDEGTVVVRPDQILSGLKGHPSDAVVSFNVSEKVKRLNGTCGGSRFNAVLLSGKKVMHDQIARLPIHGTNGSRYSATILADVIKKSAWCASLSNQSPNVVDCLEFKRTDFGFKVLATDGHIAVRISANTDLNPEEMSIPRIPLETFAKLLGKHPEDEIHVIKGQPNEGEYNELYFRFGSIFYGASTSTQRPANIEPIFNDPLRQPTRIVIVSRSLLIDMLGRLAGFADKANPIINFSLEDEKLKLSTGSSDGGCDEELSIAYAGDSKYKSGKGEVSVAFLYMHKMLSSISNDMVTLGIRDATTPLVLSDEGNDDVNTRYMLSSVRPAAPAKTKAAKATEDDAELPSDATAEEVPEAAEQVVSNPPAQVPAPDEGVVAEEDDGDPFADLEEEAVGQTAAEEPANEEQDFEIPV